ncbi:MAG TPA: GNAT family N-acetyltransferase [Conexibacter sp.]|nr:GNAT family N-acetyltransferase [Conexibacter sp.]
MSSPSIAIRRARADEPEAVRLLADYGAELVVRGRPYSPVDPPPGAAGASWVEVHEMEPPGGAFLLLWESDSAVACGGLRTLGPDLGEVKRMYVVPAARRRGHARRLLGALEEAARGIGLKRVRLDTNAQQPEALLLYEACGYAEIPDYNGSPTATHWFEKRLDS